MYYHFYQLKENSKRTPKALTGQNIKSQKQICVQLDKKVHTFKMFDGLIKGDRIPISTISVIKRVLAIVIHLQLEPEPRFIFIQRVAQGRGQ